MSKTFIGGGRRMSRAQIRGTGGRRNVGSCRMQQRTVQFWECLAICYKLLILSFAGSERMTSLCEVISVNWDIAGTVSLSVCLW